MPPQSTQPSVAALPPDALSPSTIVALLLIAMLVLMAAIELGRYRRQRRHRDEVPYPRRRLIRRLVVAFIFVIVIAMATFGPTLESAVAELTLMGLMLIVSLAGLYLLALDLRETGHEALRTTARLNHETGDALKKLLREAEEKKRHENKDENK